MPTSNGLITSRDLRKNSVKTLHITPDAVTTDEIRDLAVTFPDKIDNPIWVDSFFEPLFHNESLTAATELDYLTTIDVPAWVNNISVVATIHLQFTNTSGGDVLGAAGVLIDGEGYGGASHEAPNNSTITISRTAGADLAGVAGSSVTVGIRVFMQGATITSNKGDIAGIVIGRR